MAKANVSGMQNPSKANVNATIILEEASLSLHGDTATP